VGGGKGDENSGEKKETIFCLESARWTTENPFTWTQRRGRKSLGGEQSGEQRRFREKKTARPPAINGLGQMKFVSPGGGKGGRGGSCEGKKGDLRTEF